MTYVQPLLSILILIFIAGIYRSRRRSKSEKPVLIIVATLCLFLLSWLPFAKMVQRPFENHFPPRLPPSLDAQAIVVLSGAMAFPNPITHERRAGSDTYARCLYAAWLYKHWQPLPVLASGGPPREETHLASDAVVMQKVLEEAGVPESAIWCEGRSHSTHENALYSAAILRAKHIQKIVLVTSAFHMLRSELCFRKAGFIVFPAACDYHSFAPYAPKDFFPCWRAIRFNEDVLHEMAGLLWYWLHGWI